MRLKDAVRTEAACLIITLVVALGLTYSEPENWLGNLVSSFIFSHSIGLSISALVHLFNERLHRFRLLPRASFLVILFLAGSVIGTEIGNLIHYVFLGATVSGAGHLKLLLLNLLFGIIFGSLAFVYFSLRSSAQAMAEQLKQKEINEEKLKRLKTQAELEALQAKINPHFLFNTLNSIASLITENPAAAETTVEKLAELFRYTLQKTGNTTVRLRDELDIVLAYLDIEKIRFGDRLQFSLKSDPLLDDVHVPPLLVQGLAENSIKHGISPEVRGGSIGIDASRDGDRCIITVTDSGKGFSDPVEESGFGLRSIRERLALAYGDRAALEISSDAMTRIRISLPLS